MVGSAARMRVSSVIAPPSSSGTLKSTRTSTCLPRTSISRTVALFMLQPLTHEVRQVGDAAGIAPLVVVPGDDLDHVVSQHHRRETIDDRGVRVATEVAGDQRLVGIVEDAVHLASGGLLEGIVDSVYGGRLVD